MCGFFDGIFTKWVKFGKWIINTEKIVSIHEDFSFPGGADSKVPMIHISYEQNGCTFVKGVGSEYDDFVEWWNKMCETNETLDLKIGD